MYICDFDKQCFLRPNSKFNIIDTEVVFIVLFVIDYAKLLQTDISNSNFDFT